MANEKFDLSVVLRLIDKASGPMKKFGRVMAANGKKMEAVGQKMSLRLTAPITAFGVNAIRVGANFQSTMNMVGAVTNTTGKKFENLRNVAKDLGATTQFSAVQAGEAMRFMGMAGFDANKIMAATPKVLELAAAAQLDMGQAADLTTNIMAGFGFQAKDMARVNDVLVNTFTNANVSLPQLGEAMKKVGPVANKLGFRFTEISAALGLMGNAGIQGSEAGVALRRAFINLQKPTKQQQEAMRFMELEFKNTDGTMKDLTKIIGEYEKATKKGASETQVITSMMQIFGPRAVAPMLALLEAGSKGMEEMEKKTKILGTSTRIAQRQMAGLPGTLKAVASAFESVNIALVESGFGEFVNVGLGKFAKGLRVIGQTTPELLTFGAAIAGIFAISGPLIVGLGIISVSVAAISLPVLLIAGGFAAAAIAVGLIVTHLDEIKAFFTANNDILKVLRLGTIGLPLPPGISGALGVASAISEIVVKVQAEEGTASTIESTKTSGPVKITTENKSNVGPTLNAFGGL